MCKPVLIVLAAFACTTLTSGCSSMNNIGSLADVSSFADLPQQILGNWKLDSLKGFDLSQLAGNDLGLPNVGFQSDGNVAGFSGVNRFAGKVDVAQLAQGKFSLPSAASTRMAGSPVASDLESKFLGALSSADGAKIDGGKLLLSKGGETLMSFVR